MSNCCRTYLGRVFGLNVLVAVFLATFTTSLRAQNTNYAPGDLVLFFQLSSGVGSTNQVFASLGNTATVFRNASPGSSITITNISSALSTAFTANWKTSTSLYGGAGGSWSSSAGSSLQNGDPGRTIYTTLARSTVGTVGQANSSGFAIPSDSAMTGMASAILQQNNILETKASTGVAVIGFNPSDNTTPSTKNINPPGGSGWNNWLEAPGVQQQGAGSSYGTYGAFDDVDFMWDLYRIQARDNIANQYDFGGGIRSGEFLGTIVLTASGAVGFVAASAAPASPYDAWATGYSLDLSGDGARSADPDGDGFTNLQEFAFGTDPTVGNAALVSSSTSGSNLIITALQRTAGATSGIASYTLETRSDLTTGTWSSSGVTAVTGTPVGAYNPVTYTVPRAGALGFYRLIAVE